MSKTTRQKGILDLRVQIEKALQAAEEIELRASKDEPDMSFEQRIIAASRGLDGGDPLKDFLTHEEVEQAIKTLADVYTVTGVLMPEKWV